MRIRMLLLSLLYLMILLNGCVVLPIPTKERTVLAGKSVTQEQLAFLVPRVTTKSEVMERLGSPDAIWVEAHLFVYDWVMRRGILICALAGGYSSAAGAMDIPKHYMLIIQFDEQNRVRRFKRAVRPAFTSYGDFLKEWAMDSERISPQDAGDKKE